MSSALKQDILVKTNGEGKPIEALNKEAQQYFLSGDLEEVKLESDDDCNKDSGFKMFKVKDGGYATFCFD